MQSLTLIFIGLLILFVISGIISIIPSFRKGPVAEAVTTGGIGALLAGTYFGIIKDTILNKPSDPLLTFVIILIFYAWYVFTKLCSNLITKMQKTSSKSATQIPVTNISKDENKINEKLNNNKISATTGIFIAVIVIFMMVILYFSTSGGDEGQLAKYNILMGVMIVLGVLFAFFSGKRLNYESKIEITGFTFSYLIVFGILAPLFLYENFSFKNSITNTVLFFIWMSLTYSISNFIKYQPSYIERT